MASSKLNLDRSGRWILEVRDHERGKAHDGLAFGVSV